MYFGPNFKINHENAKYKRYLKLGTTTCIHVVVGEWAQKINNFRKILDEGEKSDTIQNIIPLQTLTMNTVGHPLITYR